VEQRWNHYWALAPPDDDALTDLPGVVGILDQDPDKAGEVSPLNSRHDDNSLVGNLRDTYQLEVTATTMVPGASKPNAQTTVRLTLPFGDEV